MRAEIRHSDVKEGAFISLPSSKSLSHRALITAALACGTSRIHGIADSQDIQATMRAMEMLGACFTWVEDTITVQGIGEKPDFKEGVVDCGESGSTLRFLIPLFALYDRETVLTGHGKLMERPQNVYQKLFAENGLKFEQEGSFLHIAGPLKAGHYTIAGDVSSQFFTGLLFSLPLCDGDSIIDIIPPFESASYVNLTLSALHRAGIRAERNGLQLIIPGNQHYQPFEARVEGDDSQMAFYAEMALIHGKPVEVGNVRHDSIQGDHVIVDLVRQFGGKVEETNAGYRFTCDHIHAVHADLSDCPDLGPALFALATQAEGTSVFTGCQRLRIKESDRIACMEEELHKLGCDMVSDSDTVRITGKTTLKEHVLLHGHNDHRLVMALSVLASLSNGCIIEDAQAVNKSYPRFFEDYRACGLECDTND
ncbi:MAG: 3-phosphoshikimate 1-carboxyvinyltransferase [Bulleidia sp.]